MGGMPGMGGDFGGIDFSKLGGAMGGEGMPDLGSLGSRVNPEDIPGYDEGDDDMPELEDADEKAEEAKPQVVDNFTANIPDEYLTACVVKS